jgi:hypothetical protein
MNMFVIFAQTELRSKDHPWKLHRVATPEQEATDTTIVIWTGKISSNSQEFAAQCTLLC